MHNVRNCCIVACHPASRSLLRPALVVRRRSRPRGLRSPVHSASLYQAPAHQDAGPLNYVVSRRRSSCQGRSSAADYPSALKSAARCVDASTATPALYRKLSHTISCCCRFPSARTPLAVPRHLPQRPRRRSDQRPAAPLRAPLPKVPA